MRLTLELLSQAPQSINPTKDRMISIRGFKISSIENLGCTEDHFDCIDLCDNDISKLNNIPLLQRLHTLLLANNRICKISDDAFDFVPNLTSLILTNNKIETLTDLIPIFKAKKLERLSLLDNPVATTDNYRKFVVGNLKYLRYLDFEKVGQKEREAAASYIETDEAQSILKTLSSRELKQDGQIHSKEALKPTSTYNVEEIEQIKLAIAKAATIEEVTELERKLRSGHFIENN